MSFPLPPRKRYSRNAVPFNSEMIINLNPIFSRRQRTQRRPLTHSIVLQQAISLIRPAEYASILYRPLYYGGLLLNLRQRLFKPENFTCKQELQMYLYNVVGANRKGLRYGHVANINYIFNLQQQQHTNNLIANDWDSFVASLRVVDMRWLKIVDDSNWLTPKWRLTNRID